MRFELTNHSGKPLDLPTYEPFTRFSVSARAGGAPVEVHRPPLDIGVMPTSIHVPAEGAATIHTPIRLRFAGDAAPARDNLIWTIAHPRKALSLRISLDLPAPFAGPCPVTFV